MEDDTTMPQDDQGNCDGTRGNRGLGRSSKKSKQKKVPQRGLGVAQLEKIRLEEQQKRDAPAILPSPSTLSSTTPPYLPLPVKNFHDSNLSPSTPLLPCEPPSEFRSPSSLQHHHHKQQQHMDVKVPSTVPLANSGGFEAGWPVVPGHGNVPKWWSSFQFESEKKNFGVDLGLPILPSVPFESSPIWPLPNLVQRTPQYQHQHQTSSPMVSVSSGTLSTSIPHFTTEPPSNQNNNCSSVPVKSMEKMVGMKRQTPYPFSLDFPHAPAFNCISSPFAEIGTNAKTPCGNGSGFNFGNSTSREVSSCLASNSEPKSKKRREENENFNGDFLTLAPPSPTAYPPSKSKLSLTFQAFDNQGNVEDQIPAAPPVFRLFNQQKQPFYGFFLPEPKEEQIGETAARIQNGHEVGKSVDLNLKL